jgi:hypothetical protein
MSETIRLFVGTSPNGEDYEAEAVLEFTARSLSSLPIEITWMRQAKAGTWSGWKCASGRTPFSHFRWGIPAACGFKGRAIYTDVDFIIRADLAELWRQLIPGVLLAKKSRKPGGKIKTCCMLFDCARARGHVPTLEQLRAMPDPQGTLTKYFQSRGDLVDAYEGDWNAIDLNGYDTLRDPRVKAIHYSRMEHQLHLPHAIARLRGQHQSHWYTGPVFAHPRADLITEFAGLLNAAQTAGLTYESFGYACGVPPERRNFTYSTHKGVGA